MFILQKSGWVQEWIDKSIGKTTQDLTTQAAYLTWNIPAPQIPVSQGWVEAYPWIVAFFSFSCHIAILDNDKWPANPVTRTDLHGLWAHTHLLTILCCTSEWHDTVLFVPENSRNCCLMARRRRTDLFCNLMWSIWLCQVHVFHAKVALGKQLLIKLFTMTAFKTALHPGGERCRKT